MLFLFRLLCVVFSIRQFNIVLLTVYRAFLSIFTAWFYIHISVVNIFCLSFLLFIGHVPEIKID